MPAARANVSDCLKQSSLRLIGSILGIRASSVDKPTPLPSYSGANRRDQEGRLACWKSAIEPRKEVG
jgi:hypothetical protein